MASPPIHPQIKAVRWSGERQWAMDAEDEATSADVAKLAELMASADGAGA